MKPHIIIDARIYGSQHTGIGRYTKNFLLALSRLPKFSHHRFTLIVYDHLLSQIKEDLGAKFNYLATNIPHYSLAEQIKLPSLLRQLKPDLVHFTHFNKPLFYFGKSVITIHDLIKHFYKGKNTTTKNPLMYWPKYLSYRLLTFATIHYSHHIIVPSNFWKKYLNQHTSTPVTVTPEAVDPKFLNNKTSKLKVGNYLLYTGNLYPHKNINIILQALPQLPNLQLKIISAKNVFQKRLRQQVEKLKLQKQVKFLGFIPDSRFKKIYSRALALIHPAFMEGFSLTGLEAMALNCPVISSNSSCLPEVYGNSVLYFNPNQSSQLVSQIKKLQNSKTLRQKLIKLGHQQVKKYSWEQTAKLTLSVYQKSLE